MPLFCIDEQFISYI